MRDEIITQTCEWCGKVFYYQKCPTGGAVRKFCCDRCAKDSRNERNRESCRYKYTKKSGTVRLTRQMAEMFQKVNITGKRYAELQVEEHCPRWDSKLKKWVN